ncbi:metalloprotease [Coemansia sp. RSA 552]|nr:metalloprotease [Coemansia sp. RSA 552]
MLEFETLKQLPSRKENPFLPPVVTFTEGFEPRTTPEGAAYTEFTGSLNESPSDGRKYRLIRLENGLVALLVHDADETKACAAMDVNVGSLADPPELQGLAHFCEHLLFMGTEKYPEENDYNAYLAAHGGYANAYTDLEDTCYFFEVGADALKGALDRFAQFFISPLFTAACTEREVRAVDSEHKKNIQNDMWRQYQLEKTLSNPKHPFSLFPTGSYETLAGAARALGVDLRERLLEFHARYYSADIMRLVIVGNDPLDRLAEWAVGLFAPISSKGITKPLFAGHPLTSNEMGKLIYLQSIRQQRSLDITFALPDVKPYYDHKPTQYLGSLLGHEGRGSVLARLKHRGWATGIVAGRSPTSGAGFDSFKVTISLTTRGLEHWKDVVRLVFSYIRLLRDSGPQPWFHDELSRIGAIEYRFMEKTDAVNLASHMATALQNRYLPPPSLLADGVVLGTFDEALLDWIQGHLRPDNVRILLAARDMDVEFNCTEKHYGVRYRVDTIPADVLREDDVFDEAGLSAPASAGSLVLNGLVPDAPAPEKLAPGGLHLPLPNAFIPDDLVVHNKASAAPPATSPTLLRHSEGLELWFKPDDRFFLPRGHMRVLLETPRAYDGPLASVLSHLLVLMLKNSLAEMTYDADTAGLWFDVRDMTEGIHITIDGFNDKLPRLLRILIQALRDFDPDATQFEVYSREVRKKLDNARHAEPYAHAQASSGFLNQSVMWRFSDKLAVLDLVTRDRLRSFTHALLEEARIVMLVLGNFTEADALQAADTVVSVLSAQPLPAYARRVTRSLLPPPGVFIHHARMPEEDNLNSCVDLSIYTGRSADRRDRVLLDLTSSILQEPFFDQLRTKEQLGYITYSSDRKYTGGLMALRLLVQSEANPAYVTLRINTFLRSFRTRIAEMTEAKFTSYVASLRVNWEEKLKSLYEESARLWRHINSGYYEFERIDSDLVMLAELARGDLIAFWDAHVNPDTAPGFSALASTVWSAKIPQPTLEEMTRFPQHSISLHGCLDHDGIKGLSLEAVHDAIHEAVRETVKEPAVKEATTEQQNDAIVNDALERLIALYLTTVDDPDAENVTKALAKVRKPNSYVRTAIAMARNHTADKGEERVSNGTNGLVVQDQDNLGNIGAVKTPAGAWAFTEAAAFRATLRQSGAPIPTRPLVPKHSEPATKDSSCAVE